MNSMPAPETREGLTKLDLFQTVLSPHCSRPLRLNISCLDDLAAISARCTIMRQNQFCYEFSFASFILVIQEFSNATDTSSNHKTQGN